MTKLNQSLDHISTIEKQNWDKLFNLIDEIKERKVQPDGKSDFQFIANPEIVSRFLDIVYELGIIEDFDWMNWNEGKNILDNQKQDFMSLDIITLCMLLTTIVRTDRIDEGYLEFCFGNGIISKILQSLKLKIAVYF